MIPIAELGENKSLNRNEDVGPGGHDAEPAEIAISGKEAAELQAGNDESPVDDDSDAAASEFDDKEQDDESEQDDGGNLEALGEGFYEVEAVRRKRVRKGQTQYFIKWRGWPESANTWEPFDNVQACADIIEDFEKSLAAKQNRRGRGKRKFGTYLLPQKKKRSSPYNTEEGGSIRLGVNNLGDEEYVKKSGSEPSDISRESPEGLGRSCVPSERSDDAGMNLSQNLSNSKELDGSVLDCRLGNDQEVLQENVILSDAGHDAVVLNASANQREPRPGTSGAFCLRADVSLGKQQPQEKVSPSVSGETGPALPSAGGETGTSLPFVGEEAASDCKEKNVQGCMSNGHHNTKEEMIPTETGGSEQQLIETSEVVVPERKTLGKEIGHYSSSSCPGEMTSGEHAKAIGNDKCIGAKKRKQGFVRRVRQSLYSQDLDMKATLDEEILNNSPDVPTQTNILKEPTIGMQGPLGGQLPEQQIVDPLASTVASLTSEDGTQFDLPAGCPPHITKIIKAVNYSNAPVNGKQEVAVLFKALRADGEEVLVDNKFMRANYPILLIEFYEQHLRYSPSTAL